jgi:hypothetical protein
LVHYLTAAGMICRPEVRFLCGDRKTRPDFLIADAHGGLLLTDHTIVNPLAASRAAMARAPSPHAAASTLEDVARVKTEKYADDAKNMGATFTPLVCSVYGLLHPDVLALLRLQSARAAAPQTPTSTASADGRLSSICCSPLSLVPSRSATVSSSTRPCRRSSLLCLALKAR